MRVEPWQQALVDEILAHDGPVFILNYRRHGGYYIGLNPSRGEDRCEGCGRILDCCRNCPRCGSQS